MPGYTYILECSNGSYYTGSTKYLLSRYAEHQCGEGANHTKKYPPVALLYYEEYYGVDTAFKREKQIQGWTRAKKEALMEGRIDDLKNLSHCINRSHCENIDLERLAAAFPEMLDPNDKIFWPHLKGGK